jgi:hypothetical protein
MQFPQGTPQEGPCQRAESFKYVETPNGGKPWTGWLASDPWWCRAHDRPRPTKPCLTWLTRKQLSCPRCSVASQPVLVGYLFLWRESDLMPCCVVAQESVWDLVEGLRFRDYVEVSRQVETGSPLAVRKCLRQKPWKSKHRLRQRAIDIQPQLLQMWKINELTEWYRCQAPESDTPVSLSKSSNAEKTVEEFDPMLRAAAARAGFTVKSESEELRSVLEGSLRKIQKREKNSESNGKHDPPPNG